MDLENELNFLCVDWFDKNNTFFDCQDCRIFSFLECIKIMQLYGEFLKFSF